jgi:hypothetical protein
MAAALAPPSKAHVKAKQHGVAEEEDLPSDSDDDTGPARRSSAIGLLG